MKKKIKKFIAKSLLFPFQIAYGTITEFRNFLYDKGILKETKLDFPVIAIGNLSVGGTGKTETARYLMELFVDLGLKPAYLSRGYKRKTKGYVRVLPKKSTAEEVGDEALMIAKSFPDVPVAVSEDRVDGALQLKKEAPFDILILDDAFQHRKIARDINLLTINGSKLPWKDALLPVGRLRERFKNYHRADLVFINKLTRKIILQGEKIPEETNIKSYIDLFRRRTLRKIKNTPLILTRYATKELLPLNDNFPKLEVKDLAKRTLVVFSGIADLESFKNMLLKHGAYLGRVYSFPDHYHFSEKNLKRITKKWEKLSKIPNLTEKPIIITTEKDIARIWNNPKLINSLKNYPVYYLKVELDIIAGNEELHSFLFEKLKLRKHPKREFFSKKY